MVTIFDHPTVATLAGYLREQHAEAARRIGGGGAAARRRAAGARRPGAAPGRARPAAGPSSSFIRWAGRWWPTASWRAVLGRAQPVSASSPPIRRPEYIREMAARYVEALRAVQPAGPYRIAGWSMGGIVAFEMARQLEAGGDHRRRWRSSTPPSPGRRVGEAERSDTEMLALFASPWRTSTTSRSGDLPRARAPPRIDLPDVDLSGLDADAALAIALDLGRQVGLLPPNLEPAELRRLFERFQANRGALASTASRAPTAASSSSSAPPTSSPARENENPTLGWGELAEREGEDLGFPPGDHQRSCGRRWRLWRGAFGGCWGRGRPRPNPHPRPLSQPLPALPHWERGEKQNHGGKREAVSRLPV